MADQQFDVVARASFCPPPKDVTRCPPSLGSPNAKKTLGAVLDLHMPVMDGFAAARELSAAQPRPYLLASSALVDAAVRRRCLQVGFDGILEKPLRLRQLRQALLMAKRSAGGRETRGRLVRYLACTFSGLLPGKRHFEPFLAN